ncbi:MAG: tRNA pseudouridine(55) synthase TruB [Christensenellales bacterium]
MDGILVINKSKGLTSNDIVKKVKKILNTKVGHTGTLDPNATGVLPLLLGNATKISKYLINHDKEYEAVIKLGAKTTTADVEGKIIEEKEVNKEKLKEENIEEVLKSFIGKQQQIPPIYSAIKVNGKKLYEYARQGKEVEIKARNIEIYDLKLLKIDSKNDELTINVKCSKGTYIRSLCEDIAVKLETIGYMKELNRIQVGEFNIKDSVTIEELKANIENKDYSNIIGIEEIFKEIPEITIKQREYEKYLNGVKIDTDNMDGIYRIYLDNKFSGLGIVENKKLKRDLVI